MNTNRPPSFRETRHTKRPNRRRPHNFADMIEYPLSDLSLDSESKTGGIELTVSDLKELIEIQSSIGDEEISNYLRRVQTFKAEHIVKRINAGIAEIRKRWPDATGPELYTAFEMCQESVDDLIASIEEEAFRNKVTTETNKRLNPSSAEEPISQPTSPASDDEESGDDENDTEFVCQIEPAAPAKTKPRQRRSKASPVETLECPDTVDPATWAQWSEARKTSYIQGEERPNAYFYRHLPPGEVQRNGAWTPEEKRLFFARMREMRGNQDTFGHEWGLFSLAIPGRVGYQCSNFYRMLLETGEMTDSRYVRGEDGKLHHTSRIHGPNKKTKGKSKEQAKNPKPKTHRTTYQKLRPITVDDVESFRLYQKWPSTPADEAVAESEPEEKKLSRYEMWALQNPLPEMTDYLTGETIRVPAISPSGFVLDYKTWLDSIAANPVDPFTLQHLNKRQIVVLTTENIDAYADKIRNPCE